MREYPPFIVQREVHFSECYEIFPEERKSPETRVKTGQRGYQPILRLSSSTQPDVMVTSFLLELRADVNACIPLRASRYSISS